jgi:capsular polysaccharide transport system permease protein
MNQRVVRLREEARTEPEADTALVPRVQVRKKRGAHLAAFVLLAVLPTLAAAIYLFGFASDQYVAEFRFNLRRASEPVVANNGNAGASPSMSWANNSGLTPSQIWDSQTIVQFIKSRDVVDALDAELGFDHLYRRADVDWLSRLGDGLSIERKTEYWRGMVEPFFDMTTGVISVSVRAFTAAEALAIANAVLKSSEKTVNELSARARQDSIAFGQEEVTKAERNLLEARVAVRAFRDKADVLDPMRKAEADISLQSHQRERLATLQSQFNSMKEAAPGSPSLRYMAMEINAIKELIQVEQSKLTQGKNAGPEPDPSTVAAILGGFEALKLEESFREKLYLLALQFSDQSRIEGMKQQLYLNAFVRPKLPEEALYPRRLRTVAIVFLIGLTVWGLGSLAYYSVRDHL